MKINDEILERLKNHCSNMNKCEGCSLFYKDLQQCLIHEGEPPEEWLKTNLPFKGRWEEFEIDENGFFVVNPVNKDDSPKVYHWWQWTKFLSDNDEKYNDFGGWVYEMSLFGGGKTEVLATSPHFLEDDEELCSYIRLNHKDEVKPAYPTKILFWRYKK